MKYLLLLLMTIGLSYSEENPFANDVYEIEPEYRARITWIVEDWHTGEVKVTVANVFMILPQILKLKHKLTDDEWDWFHRFGSFNLVIYNTTI